MILDTKPAGIKRVSGQNLYEYLGKDGSFFIQETDNPSCSARNLTEIAEASAYTLRELLDEGNLIVFVPGKNLVEETLEDMLFRENVDEYYRLCDALQEAADNGVMELGDNQLIFNRKEPSGEVIVYDFEGNGSDLGGAASSLFWDLIYNNDGGRMEMITTMLEQMLTQSSEREFLGDLWDIAQMREGILKEEYLQEYC